MHYVCRMHSWVEINKTLGREEKEQNQPSTIFQVEFFLHTLPHYLCRSAQALSEKC
jgi:hypothetical protein